MHQINLSFKNKIWLVLILKCSSVNLYADNNTYRTYKLDGFYAQAIYGYAFEPAADGNGYIVLYHYPTAQTTPVDGYRLMKRDTSGNTLWSKLIHPRKLIYNPNFLSYGSENNLESFYKTSDNNYLLVNLVDSSIIPPFGAGTYFKIASFTKFDESGNSIWTHSSILDTAYKATYISTTFDKETDCTYFYGFYPFISKYDASGQMLWCKKIIDSSYISVNCIEPMHGGNLFIAGRRDFTNTDYCIILDSAGNNIWQRNLQSGESINLARFDLERNKIMLFGKNNSGIFISELDTSSPGLQSYLFTDTLFGSGQHGIRISVPLPEKSFLLYIDTFYLVVDSAFHTTSIFDAGYSSSGFTSSSHGDPTIAKYCENKVVDLYTGSYYDSWANYTGASSEIRELTTTGATCSFADNFSHQLVSFQIQFSQSYINDSSLLNSVYYDSELADSLVSDTSTLITCLFDYIPPVIQELQFEVYPNPVSEFLTINCNGIYKAEMYNAMGSCIFKNESKNLTLINCKNYPSGIYFLKVSSEGLTGTKKLLIEW
jgi:hypothetical protein